MIPNNTKRYQTIPNDTKRYQTTPNNTKRYQTIPNNTKRYQTIPNDTKQYQTIPNDTKRYQTIPNDTKRYQTIPNDTKRYQTDQTDTKMTSCRREARSWVMRWILDLDISLLDIGDCTGKYGVAPKPFWGAPSILPPPQIQCLPGQRNHNLTYFRYLTNT